MNGHQQASLHNRIGTLHGVAAAALTMLGMVHQPLHAQQNAGTVGPRMGPLIDKLCEVDSQSLACNGSLKGAPAAQFAPDKYVAIGTTSLAAAQVQIDVVKDRMALLRDGSGAPPSAPAQGAAQAAPTFRSGDAGAGNGNLVGSSGGDVVLAGGLGLFIRAEGQRDKSDSTSFDPGYKRRLTAFTLGADYRIQPQAIVGLAFGSRNTRTDLTREGTSSGRLEDRGSSVSVYGTWFPTQSLHFDAIAQFGRSSFDVRRDMPDISDTAVGKTSSKERSFSIGTGYSLSDGRWNWGPQARLSYSRISIDGFTEQENVSSTALKVVGRSFNSLVSGLGAQASYAWSQPWGVLVPNLSLEWNHQFRQDKVRSILGSVAVDPDGLLADIPTTPVDKNYFTLDVGLAAHLGQGRSAILNYSTVLGRSGQSSNVVTAELRLEF